MNVRFWSLNGTNSYAKVRELQLRLVELRAAGQVPDTVLFLEHDPVITRGRGLQYTGVERPKHMPLPGPIPSGIEFSETERGGDLTYHGPGQLVVYPICKLDGQGLGPEKDVAGFLRLMEKVIVDELSSWGFNAESRANATGVWIGGRKVVSAGIAVRKWVTYHGLAINCVNDLKPFHLISPCGFNPEVMARLGDLLAEKQNMSSLAGWDTSDARSWRIALESRLARRMSSGMAGGIEAESPRIERMDLEEARLRVEGRIAFDKDLVRGTLDRDPSEEPPRVRSFRH